MHMTNWAFVFLGAGLASTTYAFSCAELPPLLRQSLCGAARETRNVMPQMKPDLRRSHVDTPAAKDDREKWETLRPMSNQRRQRIDQLNSYLVALPSRTPDFPAPQASSAQYESPPFVNWHAFSDTRPATGTIDMITATPSATGIAGRDVTHSQLVDAVGWFNSVMSAKGGWTITQEPNPTSTP